MSRRESRWALLWAVIVVGLTCLPYLAAWWLAPDGTQYTGLLVNPLDGETYFAKMQQGARGDWLFHLPFTPEPHDGVFVYPFYLALGHLSALLRLPVPVVYHLARATAGLFLLIVAYRFIAHFFEQVRTRRVAFLLLAFSAGLGWLMATLGVITADLWVVEGFTFLSVLVNPHFPLAIGLMQLIFLQVLGLRAAGGEPQITGNTTWRWSAVGCAGLGLALATVQPFVVPIALAVLALYLAALAWQSRRLPWGEIILTGTVALAAAPVMVYDLYVYRTNPAMTALVTQDVNWSLPPWNYALSYGLILVLAITGVPATLRRGRPADLLVLSWVAACVVLLYLPSTVQRRFITGMHVPLAILAARGLEQVVWPRLAARRRALVTGLIVGLTTLTTFFVPLVAVTGAAQGRAPLVMSSDEAAAWSWLQANTTWTDTVLAPVDTGQFIPAWAGNRVVYGHPLETIDADIKKTEVFSFYSPDATTAERLALLERYDVRYVFLGAGDLAAQDELGVDVTALGLVQVWARGDAALYRTKAAP
jgi:hypothetical protein